MSTPFTIQILLYSEKDELIARQVARCRGPLQRWSGTAVLRAPVPQNGVAVYAHRRESYMGLLQQSQSPSQQGQSSIGMGIGLDIIGAIAAMSHHIIAGLGPPVE